MKFPILIFEFKMYITYWLTILYVLAPSTKSSKLRKWIYNIYNIIYNKF